MLNNTYTQPLISIILPCFNAEGTIRHCIESVLNQSYINFELIIVNDGSTDSTLSICEAYAHSDKRIHLMSKENGGVSSSRNIGLNISNGEWITFIDSDDSVGPDWIDSFVKQSRCGADLIIQGFSPTGINATFFGEMHFEDSFMTPQDSLRSLYLNLSIGYLWCKAFRSDIIKSQHIRFNTDLVFKEDELFVLQYMSSCKVVRHLTDCNYFYNVPDFHTKYSLKDEFSTIDCEMSFKTKINYPEWFEDSLFRRLTQVLFDGYRILEWDSPYYLARYCDITEKWFPSIKKQLSLFSRLMFMLPPVWGHYGFWIKNFLFKHI